MKHDIFSTLLSHESLYSNKTTPLIVMSTIGAGLSHKVADSADDVIEGMRRIINECRAKSGFDPMNPDSDLSQFTKFSAQISMCPDISLDEAKISTLHQSSKESEKIINSFVDYIQNIPIEEKAKLKSSIEKVTSLALDKVNDETPQKEVGFIQGILSEKNGRGLFSLYYSSFSIHTTQSSDKNSDIVYHSDYEVRQAHYSLTPSTWARVKTKFTTPISMDIFMENLSSKNIRKPGKYCFE